MFLAEGRGIDLRGRNVDLGGRKRRPPRSTSRPREVDFSISPGVQAETSTWEICCPSCVISRSTSLSNARQFKLRALVN
eukprot:15474168-Alexandrium_andersonii.AAC.1